MAKPVLPYLKLCLGVVAISFSAILVKWAAVDPTVSAFYRTTYSAGFLFLMTLLDRKNQLLVRNPAWILPALLASVFLTLDLIIWHKTILYIGAGPATLLGNTQVIFVALLAFFFFREPFHPALWLLLPLIFLGLFLSIPPAGPSVSPTKGFLMGVTVGWMYAGFLLCLRWAHRRARGHYPEVLSLALIMAGCAILIGVYGRLAEAMPVGGLPLRAHAILLLLALVPQTFGWLLIKSSITQMPAHQGSLLLLIQPVLTTLWGVWFFSEPLGIIQFLGMTMAVGLIGLYQLRFTASAAEQPSTSFDAG